MGFTLHGSIRHFQLSLRYDIRYTRNFNRFLGGISRLSHLVGENPILPVHVHDQICLIDFVYSLCVCLKKSEVFELKKNVHSSYFGLLHRSHAC